MYIPGMSVVPPTRAYFGIAQSSLLDKHLHSQLPQPLKVPQCSSSATFHFNREPFKENWV